MSHKQYKQLSKKEREEIRYFCVKHGHSVRETADLLSRNPSTISRGHGRALQGYRFCGGAIHSTSLNWGYACVPPHPSNP